MAALFEHYFELGKPETKSPFIKPQSRKWGKDLDLKASLFAAALLIISFAFSFYPMLTPVGYALLAGVYFFAGIPSLIESLEDLINFEVNIDVLMTLAAFSSVLIGTGFEGGLLLVLFSVSGAMEEAVRSKAKSAISSLHKLSPTTAVLVSDDGSLKEVSVREVLVGQHILVKSGQIVPLDGKVIQGATSVNLVHITGENFPVRKTIGDEIAAGARNLEGAVTLQVERTSGDSTLSKIIELVTQAQEARPRLQRWFDSLSRTYAISIILAAAFFALSFPLLLHIPFLGKEGSLYRALSFLIAASPCALIIAIPTAYLSAVSSCARMGILLKGGMALDQLVSCRMIAFDKTGTLTTGELTLTGIQSSFPKEEALAIAIAMERGAVHPIAKAILAGGANTNKKIESFRTIPGWGLEASFDGKPAYLGHPGYILDRVSADTKAYIEEQAEKIRSEGQLLALLLFDGKPAFFCFRDTPRQGISQTISTLQHKWKMSCLMLTGDHFATAQKIAEELGLADWRADLKPEDKLQVISELAKTKNLAMVGDGINDAPALARATVGICMGKVGTTAAMDASDIILLRDNIELLGWLVAKAHKTVRIVNQNLVLATSAILFASLPALGGYIPLWLAVILHEGGTVLVGLNALRLLKR